MEKTASTMGEHYQLLAVTIPGSGSAVANLETLIIAATGYDHTREVVSAKINPAGADYKVSTSSTLSPFRTITAGDLYTEPAVAFLADTYLRASGAGTIAVVVTIYWK